MLCRITANLSEGWKAARHHTPPQTDELNELPHLLRLVRLLRDMEPSLDGATGAGPIHFPAREAVFLQ